MSVYTLARLPGVSRNTVIIVGWDAPLDTFFAQVWRRPSHDGGLIRDLVAAGIRPYEASDADTVLDAVKPYARIPADLRDRLLADRRDESDPTEGRLRTALLDLLNAPAH